MISEIMSYEQQSHGRAISSCGARWCYYYRFVCKWWILFYLSLYYLDIYIALARVLALMLWGCSSLPPSLSGLALGHGSCYTVHKNIVCHAERFVWNCTGQSYSYQVQLFFRGCWYILEFYHLDAMEHNSHKFNVTSTTANCFIMLGSVDNK